MTASRQIVLDTETTGLEPEQGHRIIEIGCVEIVNRRVTGNHYHIYLNPERDIDEGAVAVHGLTTEMLADQPRFVDIVDDLLTYLGNAELIIHNAPFDLGFLNYELAQAGREVTIESRGGVRDTLIEARERHPGQRNSLDALCKRYAIDNSERELHGALLDAQLLAEVYLAMTGGQTAMALDTQEATEVRRGVTGLARRLEQLGRRPRVVRASDAEREAHSRRLAGIESAAGRVLWEES